MNQERKHYLEPRPCSSKVLKRRLRCAVAINNVAVRLLQRNCYAQARESLQHAVSLMETATSSVQASRCGQIDVSDGGESYVHQALAHLAEPKPAKKSVLLFEVLTTTKDGLLTSSGELPDGPTCLQSVLQTAPSAFTAFLIRIEDSLAGEGSATTGSTSTDLPVALMQRRAMLSHNLGVACFCESKTTAKGRESRALLQLALRLSSLSISLLTEENASASLREQDKEDHIMVEGLRNLPCLIIALLNSLINILQESRQDRRAKHFYSLLIQYRSAALDIEDASL